MRVLIIYLVPQLLVKSNCLPLGSGE